MKILYMITKSEIGGAQLHVLELLRYFRDHYEVHLAVGQEGFLTREARNLGIPTHLLPDLIQPVHPIRDLRAVAQAVRLLRAIRPQLVHTHSSKAGQVGRIAARLVGIPSIFTAHGWAFAEGTSWKRKAIAIPGEWLAARWTSAFITVSESDQVLAERYRIACKSKVFTIHNGIPDVPQRARPDAADEPIITMVARFEEPKDHITLLRALSGIHTRFRVCLVGDGPTRPRVEHMARTLGLLDRIEFVGTSTCIADILSRSHIFTLISNWEGLPLAILEAMRAGLPVVASDVGGVREILVDGETGYLVPRGDIGAVRDRLSRLLQHPELRRRMGAAGRLRYETYFTIDKMLKKTHQVYKMVLNA